MGEVPPNMGLFSQSSVDSSIKREEMLKNEMKRKQPPPRQAKPTPPKTEDPEAENGEKMELLRKIQAYREVNLFKEACMSTRNAAVSMKSTRQELLYVYESIRNGITTGTGIESGRDILKNLLLQLEGIKSIFPTMNGLGQAAAKSLYTAEGEKLLWEWQIEKNGLWGFSLHQNLYLKTLMFFGFIAWSVHLSNTNPSHFQACRMEMMEGKTSKQE